MVINFRARGISRGTRKLTQTFTLIKDIYKLYLMTPPNIIVRVYPFKTQKMLFIIFFL